MNEIRIGAEAVFCNDELFVLGDEKQTVNVRRTTDKYHERYSGYNSTSFCATYETFPKSRKLVNNFNLKLSYFSAQRVEVKIYLIGGYLRHEKGGKEAGNCTRTFRPSKANWKNTCA